ncbi:uncharacterized protein TA04280 [Theileria annulata]|uniref:Uncharacterized protein n=1 Tax=Theileria annulata TaxID=5874 RepID=Q4UC51_THEAN|nr:uncharacterized protein TA04280 [Theileria annulata]CAI75600.1 hypothetical protein TA04280 [Theileria annulata]|eukprot:XP_955076.1 hypothetical protein TA04280 [Theileria annulata]
MFTFRILYRKIRRLIYLSKLVKRPDIIPKLDEFWGIEPNYKVPKKFKKRKKSISIDVIKDEKNDVLNFFDKKPVESTEKVIVNEDLTPELKEHESEQDYEYINEKEFFKESVNDLRKLIYPHLDPISKRHFDELKLTALGGKVSHNRKMPYKEFLQRQKALKKHLEKNKKMEIELGVKLGLDKKGGFRHAQLQKRRRLSQKRKNKPLFSTNDKNGFYHIKL